MNSNLLSRAKDASGNRRRRQITPPISAVLTAMMIVLCGSSAGRADEVTDWNTIMEETVATADPAAQGRAAVIVQVAVFDAVNSIVGEFEPYLEKISAPPDASPEAAAIAAAHHALVALFPESAAKLETLRAASLAALPDGPEKEQGIATGVAAAVAILALRADDGFDTDVPYTPGTKRGEWRPTPPDFTPAFRPGLGLVAPFAIKSGAHFRVPPPPRLRSHKYARDFREVKDVGRIDSADRPQDRADVVRFFAAVDTIPTHHASARQLSAVQGKSLSENARIFALLAITDWDTAVACFESKYSYNTWRPITAIQAGDTDGNRRTEADPTWEPLIGTPPFPGYPAGSSAFNGGARVLLEHFFGEDGFSVTLSHPTVPDVTLHYTDWEQLSRDIDDARVYGGVHFRFDQQAGFRQGTRIGRYILKHELGPVDQRDCPAPPRSSATDKGGDR